MADDTTQPEPTRSIRRSTLHDQGLETDLLGSTPAERLAMMWPLALDAWAFLGEPVVEPRLPRHIVRILRRGVEFLLVGAYALASHGLPRATGDIDLWVRPTPENAERVIVALARFGAPIGGMKTTDLTEPGIEFQVGVAPRRVDILTAIDGVEFDEAWPDRIVVEIEGLQINVLGRKHLLLNKRATGRPKDLADALWLESQGES